MKIPKNPKIPSNLQVVFLYKCKRCREKHWFPKTREQVEAEGFVCAMIYKKILCDKCEEEEDCEFLARLRSVWP